MHDIEHKKSDISHLLIVPLVVLACGHMLSNLVRTLPAIAVDVMAPDLHSSPHEIASLTAAYHFTFAVCQIPVGAALDRFSVRAVSLTLLAATIVGCAFAALSSSPLSFLLAQSMLGMATSGMLMCPMTLAARELPPLKFGLWSGLILSIGNMGMLLSASPLAWAVDNYGWRAGFWISLGFGLIIAAAVALLVPRKRLQQDNTLALLGEMVEVARLAISPRLRGIIAIALVSLSVMLVLRGLWGRPWLMDVKGLSRLEAGNVLFLFTLALIAGPFIVGVVERKFGHPRLLLTAYQLIAAGLLFLMAGGAPAGVVSTIFGTPQMPARYDIVILVLLGFVLSSQPLIYTMTKQAVTMENAGKALSAVNLAFFLGTAAMQSATDPIGARWGLPIVLMFMATALIAGTLAFLYLTHSRRRSQD